MQTKPVFGVGIKNAKVMFIGEAPGINKEKQGTPFVGKAGKILDTLLATIELKRTDVYITNVLKCRPPNNRTPLPQEIKLCLPYLAKEIAIIQPKLIVTHGRIAAQSLLSTTKSIELLRDHLYRYGPQKIAVLITYHPAYLLRVPNKKYDSYIDFLKIKKYLSLHK